MRAETKPAILHVLYVEPKGDRNQKGIYPSYFLQIKKTRILPAL